MSDRFPYHGPAFFSYGFRPFFLSAALFAGLAVPAWVLVFVGGSELEFLFTPREWHVHEMLFGFLPCVITGFLLTAIPNWTDRPPMRGMPLIGLYILWVAGRLAIATAWVPFVVSAIIDISFLLVVAGILWREVTVSKSWSRLPICVVIGLFVCANIFFHIQLYNGAPTQSAESMALALIMILLALIGGRVTPSFTEDFFVQESLTKQPASFSGFDAVAIGSILLAVIAWNIWPESQVTGGAFFMAGLINVVRLSRWYGWLTWPEPLVLILHIGYAWLAVSLVLIGGSILGFVLPMKDAVHALTTGAIGVMTLGIMTRASLGHTGHLKQADKVTTVLYALVNLGALLRVFGHTLHISELTLLVLAGTCWSGAYLLFAMRYGLMLCRPALDE